MQILIRKYLVIIMLISRTLPLLFGICFLALPTMGLAQAVITGRVFSRNDHSPVADASVFISNSSIGAVTAKDGTFRLTDVKPGKYELVVTNIGFETYAQTVTVTDKNADISDVLLKPTTIALQAVVIKAENDLNRERYLNTFKEEFIGTSMLAKDCKILNPEVLDFQYDEKESKLTASSIDFLIIENIALGYRLKYLLNEFSLDAKDPNKKNIFYKGPFLFQQLQGTPAQERRWERNRLEVYRNSPMHFFRALSRDRLRQENFLVFKFISYDNPERPTQNLINSRIQFYKNLPSLNSKQRDSLAYWTRKLKLPTKLKKFVRDTLKKKDLIVDGNPTGPFELRTDNDGLLISYSKSGHFNMTDQLDYLYNSSNHETTFAKLNSTGVLFYANGILADPYSLIYSGVWAQHRIAELLPINYEPPLSSPEYLNQEDIADRLKAFNKVHPTEKVYLHFDKPYYASGDTIYFKAYVTDGERHFLSDNSGVLHLDLINSKSKIDQSIKLQLTNGIAWADIALPDSLQTGKYRLRAWTKLTLYDSCSYFEKTISVGSLAGLKPPQSAQVPSLGQNSKADLQFFPEGGELVAGINSQVAFKAIDTNGLGINLKGVVFDSENRQVTTFASSHLGMGSFSITPKASESYHAQVTYFDGSTDEIPLPKTSNNGITLSVNTDSLQKATLKLEANQAFFAENKNKAFALVIYSGGVATTISCTLDSSVMSFDLVKRRLFTGVNIVTLFTAKNEPIAERIFFIQNQDLLTLNIDLDKKTYHTRDKVGLKLIAKTRADSASIGNFSIAVTDKSKVPIDEDNESTILSNLLLTSDLKGDIESPNYYFTADSSRSFRKQKELDIVMMTHGYRRFSWKQVLSLNTSHPQVQKEKGIEIAGTVTTLLGKPIAKSTVSLIPKLGGPILYQQTDENGNFKFDSLAFSDSTEFFLSATNEVGKSDVKIAYKQDFTVLPLSGSTSYKIDTAFLMTSYLVNHKAQWDDYAKYGWPKGHILNEVKIRAIKTNDHYKSSSLLGPGHADQVMHADEIEKIGGMLSTSLEGKLHGVTLINGGKGAVAWLTSDLHLIHGSPMLIVIDGANMGKAYPIDNIRSSDVETVEVLRFASASIYGSEGGNGVLVITTKQGKGLQSKDIPSTGILPITVKGFYRAREFYAPKYEANLPSNPRPDLRSTIYWNPAVVTDKDGNANFEFYSADAPGTYRVVVEGIDNKGDLGRRVFFIKVE